MKKHSIIFSIVILALMTSCGPTVVTRPAAPVVVVPPAPGPNHVYVQGGWGWNRGARAYQWREGYWAVPPRRNTVWVDGAWVQSRRGYRYNSGHWR